MLYPGTYGVIGDGGILSSIIHFATWEHACPVMYVEDWRDI